MITVARLILSELAPLVSALHAVVYTYDSPDERPTLPLLASYAYEHPSDVGTQLELGQGLIGQCALEKNKILLHTSALSYFATKANSPIAISRSPENGVGAPTAHYLLGSEVQTKVSRCQMP